MFGQKLMAVFAAAVLLRAGQDYSSVLVNMGYSPAPAPSEVVELTIPEVWGPVYENYNELQRSGGFDLSAYKGRSCTRYTYEIPDLFARGNILVCDGEVIGGDICSITIDGIMLPLRRDKLK